MNIALYISTSEKAKTAAFDVIDFLKEKNCNIFIPNETVQGFENYAVNIASKEKIRQNCKILISLGGDGTFLRSAEIAIGYDISLFGFNLGTLGFLTGSGIENYKKVINRVLSGDYKTKERLILDCSVTNGTETLFQGKALNEVTIFRANDMKLLDLSFTISGVYAGNYRADGLAVASPTGSTAYSLSAGGPIVSPNVECLLLTAICPHTLSARPLIASPSEVVEVTESNGKEMNISLDGHFNKIVDGKSKINVKKADKGLKIISLENDFYTVVRNKLGWVV